MTQQFSVKRAVKIGWRGATGHLLFFVGMLAVVTLVSFAFQLMVEAVDALPRAGTLTLLAAIVAAAMQWVMALGAIKITLTVVAGQKPAMGMLFSQYRKLGSYAAAIIVYLVVVGVGLLLFVAPGVWLGLRFHLFPYAIVDRNLSWREALKFNDKITQGFKWRLVGFYIVIYLINILGFLALGIGMLVSIPVAMVSSAAAYRMLADQAAAS